MSEKTLAALGVLFAGGTIARILVSDEPFDARKFIGEMILAMIGAVVMWSFGILQGMSFWQLLLIGSLTSLGGVRFIEWVIKILKTMKSGS